MCSCWEVMTTSKLVVHAFASVIIAVYVPAVPSSIKDKVVEVYPCGPVHETSYGAVPPAMITSMVPLPVSEMLVEVKLAVNSSGSLMVKEAVPGALHGMLLKIVTE